MITDAGTSRQLSGFTRAAQSQQRLIDVPAPLLSRCVTYEILARANGAVDITVTLTTGLTVRRRDLASHAEAHAALQDLRIIIDALGLDLIQSSGPAYA